MKKKLGENMAKQIKVVDTNGNEHFFLINSEADIYFSFENNGLYRKNYEDYRDEFLEDISLDDIRQAISFHDYSIEDLGFDRWDYEEDVLSDASVYDLYKAIKNYSPIEELIKYMEKDGYIITKGDSNE
jgi:hypothetical protein